MNEVIAEMNTRFYSSMFMPGTIGNDLRKTCSNLVIYPRLHFMVPSIYPVLGAGHPSGDAGFTTFSEIKEIGIKTLSPQNSLAGYSCDSGQRLLATTLVLSGEISNYHVDEFIYELKSKKLCEQLADWTPNPIQIATSRAPSTKSDVSACALSNHTGITSCFSGIYNSAHKMLEKKAFLHQYLEHGLDESDLKEAFDNVKDLMNSYDELNEK